MRSETLNSRDIDPNALASGTQPNDPAFLDSIPGVNLRGDYTQMRADYTTEQNWSNYTAQEHQLWRRLYERQVSIAKRYADQAFLQGLDRLRMPADHIPNLEETSTQLQHLTGWHIVPVPGLIPDHVFFDHLARRQFPVTVWIRRPDEMDYLVEPDVFHDFFGHVPLLTQPVFAEYLQEYGKKGAEALRLEATKLLSRLFWYMVEFGLIKSTDGIRAYGAGMLSSATETAYSVDSPLPHRLRFDLGRVMQTDYRIDAFQETYFVLDSYQELFAAMQQPFAPLYAELKGRDPIVPTRLLPTDDVLQPGRAARS
jgi:phenylalanine-4-hydroxylase